MNKLEYFIKTKIRHYKECNILGRRVLMSKRIFYNFDGWSHPIIIGDEVIIKCLMCGTTYIYRENCPCCNLGSPPLGAFYKLPVIKEEKRNATKGT